MGGFGSPLMGIPTLQQWLADTALRTPRSSEMKAVDKAIENYNKSRTPENIGLIRVALAKWIKSKGPAWENSERNRAPKKPISRLVEITVAMKAKLPPAERAALQVIVDNNKNVLYNTFKDARLDFPIFNGVMNAATADKSVKTAVAAAKSAPASIAKTVLGPEMLKAINDLFGSDIQQVTELVAWITAEAGLQVLVETAKHVADMIPILSLVSGGVKVLSQWGMTIYSAYKEVNAYTHRKAVAEGAAQAAYEGLQAMLARARNNYAAKASITSAGFAANVGLHAAKGAGAVLAPVVGAVEASAQATRVLVMFAIQVREAIIIHKALKDPKSMTLETLSRAPLLGCYVLAGANTSELGAIMWDEFGQAGWMTEVEKMAKDLHPLQTAAAGVIQGAPFKLAGIHEHRVIGTTKLTVAEKLVGYVA